MVIIGYYMQYGRAQVLDTVQVCKKGDRPCTRQQYILWTESNRKRKESARGGESRENGAGKQTGLRRINKYLDAYAMGLQAPHQMGIFPLVFLISISLTVSPADPKVPVTN